MFGNVDYLAQSLNHASLMTDLSVKKVASTGDPVKLSSLNQGAGGVSFATGVMNDSSSKRNTINSFQNAISYMQTQNEGLRQAEQIYKRMHSIASLAADSTTDDDTRKILNDEFNILIEASRHLASSEFNGVKLFDSRASTKKYSVSFTSGLTNETTPTEFTDKNNNGVFNNGELGVWEVTNDVLHNSGKLRIKVNSGVAGDRYILKQGDDIIFDTGYWSTKGNAKQFDYDEFEVEWGPDRNTSFKFFANPNGNNTSVDLDGQNGIKGDGDDGVIPIDSNYDNKSFIHKGNTKGYLTQLGLTNDGSVSGIETQKDVKFSGQVGQVKTYDSNDESTFLTLRIESTTLFQIDSDPFDLPDLNPKIAGTKGDLQVELHHLGLGLLREDNVNLGYPQLSIDSRSNALKAVDVIIEDIEGLATQRGNLSSNFSRIQRAEETVNRELMTYNKVISQLNDQQFSEEIGILNKFKFRRSSSSSLMSRIMNLNKEMAETLI